MFLKVFIVHPRKLGWYRAWSQLTFFVTGSRQLLFPSLSTAVLSVGCFGVLLILLFVQARRGSPSPELTYTPDIILFSRKVVFQPQDMAGSRLGEWDMFFYWQNRWCWCQSPLFVQKTLSQPILLHVIQWVTNPITPMYVTHTHTYISIYATPMFDVGWPQLMRFNAPFLLQKAQHSRSCAWAIISQDS